MSVHTINLSAFWIVTPTVDGQVRHTRKFGRPRTLDPHETAWLVGDAAPGTGTLNLNGQLLGPVQAQQPFAFNITPHLQPRNDAVLTVDAVGTLGAVRLEIRAESMS
jgi:hypothetical protein